MDLVDHERRNPRKLLVFRSAEDPGPGGMEGLLDGQAGSIYFAQKLAHEEAVLAVGILHHRIRRRRIHDQRPLVAGGSRQSQRHLAEAPFPRRPSGCVEDDDLQARAAVGHLVEEPLDVDPVAPHIGLGPDLRIDRDQVALALLGLDPVTAEIDQRDRSGLDLLVEPMDGKQHCLLGQILADRSNIEIATAQFIGQHARILDGMTQRFLAVRIDGVADDQGDLIGGVGRRRR